MYPRAPIDSTTPPRWSVRAEFTISHPGVDNATNPPRADTVRDGDAVRMTYSWSEDARGDVRSTSTPVWANERSPRRPATPTWTPRLADAAAWTNERLARLTATPPWGGGGGVRSTSTPAAPPSYVEKREPRVIRGDGGRYYGYQKGSLLFTSTPPPRRPFYELPKRIQDSGYGSDLLSPNSSHQSNSLPRRISQPYDRRCRSTCNITLSTNVSTEGDGSQSGVRSYDGSQSGSRSASNRTQSLRCQTPTIRSDRRDSYYGCGDPWCHHSHEEFSKISPVLETREDSSTATKRPSRASTFAAADRCETLSQGSTYTINSGRHSRESQDSPNTVVRDTSYRNLFSPQSDRFFRGSVCPVGYTNYNDKKDACVQTAEMVDKCTSPYLKKDSFNTSPKPFQRTRKYGAFSRRKTEPISPASHNTFSPDSLENVKLTRRVVRSTNVKRIPAVDRITKEASPALSKTSDSLKKPRTVHIDVYCTGTEPDSNDSTSDSSDNATISTRHTASTPQTVFENEKVRITHKQANVRDVPRSLQKVDSETQSKGVDVDVAVQEESDDESVSTAYPSKLSSYSNIGDYSASVSSMPRSWTSYSMSSCAIPDDCDSIANTSWKDTFSDIDSLLQSRSSIAPTESLDFVPRRLYSQNQSIDEAPEYERKDLPITPSVESLSLQPSDSFEYANSEDRYRIMRMEEMLKTKQQQINKPWHTPRDGKMLLVQQKKMQEYMDKKIKAKNSGTKESDSDDSEKSGKGWTFVKNEEKKLKRDGAFRRPSQEKQEEDKKSQENKPFVDQGSLSDSSPSSASKSPSAVSLRQRLSLDPNLRAPFTILPGIYTEQRTIAKKFGQIVNVMRKPGHHIGPAKNPNCLCEHCQRHFESIGYRNRTRSVGDPPTKYVQNWKEFLAGKNENDKTSNNDV